MFFLVFPVIFLSNRQFAHMVLSLSHRYGAIGNMLSIADGRPANSLIPLHLLDVGIICVGA